MTSQPTGARRAVVVPETDYSYHNHYFDKDIRFTPKRDEVMVTFHPPDWAAPSGEAAGPAAPAVHVVRAGQAADLDAHENNMLRILKEQGLSPGRVVHARRCYAVVQLGPEEDSEQVAASLRSVEGVANALPVLIDDEGAERYLLPDEFTVQFMPGLSRQDCRRIAEETGCWIVREGHFAEGHYTLTVPAGKGLFATMRAVSALEEVEFAEPSEVRFKQVEAKPGTSSAGAAPTNKLFGQQWGLNNLGQQVDGKGKTPALKGGVNGVDISAVEAWKLCRGSGKVIVVVLENGLVSLTHKSLKKKFLRQGEGDIRLFNSTMDYILHFMREGDTVKGALDQLRQLDELPTGKNADFSWPVKPLIWNADEKDSDFQDHQEHVTGIIAADWNIPEGTVGLAPDCPILPIAMDFKSDYEMEAFHNIAMRASRDRERRYVVNCSYTELGFSASIHQAIKRAVQSNVVLVASAGNDSSDLANRPVYPACLPEMITVANIDNMNKKNRSSNYGKDVDVSAPGTCIWSAKPVDTYFPETGTSMAAPLVSGLAALIWSYDVQENGSFTLSNQDVRRIIETTCDEIDKDNDKQYKGKLGRGRINAHRALVTAGKFWEQVKSEVSSSGGFYPWGYLKVPASAGKAPVSLPSTKAKTYFKQYTAPAFPSLPSPRDIRQGEVNSSALLASLIAVLNDKAPVTGSPKKKGAPEEPVPYDPLGMNIVLNMIGPTPDKNMSRAYVRLWDMAGAAPVPKFFLVDKSFPAYKIDEQMDELRGAGAHPLWVPIVEKAFAEKAGGYEALEKASAKDVMDMLLGGGALSIPMTGRMFPDLALIQEVYLTDSGGDVYFNQFNEKLMDKIEAPENQGKFKSVHSDQEALNVMWGEMCSADWGSPDAWRKFFENSLKVDKDSIKFFAGALKKGRYRWIAGLGLVDEDAKKQLDAFTKIKNYLKDGRPLVATAQAKFPQGPAQNTVENWFVPDHTYVILSVREGSKAKDKWIRMRSTYGAREVQDSQDDPATGAVAVDSGGASTSTAPPPASSLPPPMAWAYEPSGPSDANRRKRPKALYELEFEVDLRVLFNVFETVTVGSVLSQSRAYQPKSG